MDFTLSSLRRLQPAAGRVILDHALLCVALLTIAFVTFGMHPKSTAAPLAPAAAEAWAQ